MDKKEGFEKTVTILMVMAIWLLAGMSAYIPQEAESAMAVGEVVNEYPGIIRFHVIANSDSKEDQELKLGVRDYVLPRMEKEITGLLKETEGESRQEAITRQYVSKNLKQIQAWAEEYVHEQGFEYKIRMKLGVQAIPAKQYDDLYFPAGNYEALTITIGEGAGQNWWCVVFPPLCLIDCEDSAYKDAFEADGQGRIILKSKIKEMMKGSRKA